MLRALGRTAASIGVGLASGAVGTAAMTVAQKIEMSVTEREPSTLPADAVDAVTDVVEVPDDEASRLRASNLFHWEYGTSLGAIRGLLGATSLPPLLADLVFFTAVATAPMVFLPALDVAAPPSEWRGEQIAIETGHHLVYATAVAVAWRLLDSRSGWRSPG